jgi:hypothetical protein
MVIHSICSCKGFDEDIKIVVTTNFHWEGYQMLPKYMGEEVIDKVLFEAYGQCGDARPSLHVHVCVQMLGCKLCFGCTQAHCGIFNMFHSLIK